MTRSVIVDTGTRVVFHSALVLSIYFLVTGHNQPGGGFVGGLVAAAAFALVYVAGGVDAVRSLSRVPPSLVLGCGLALSASTALAPLVIGDAILESGHVATDVPGLGHIKVATTLLFDVGVYGVVVGLVLLVIQAFGDDPAAEAS